MGTLFVCDRCNTVDDLNATQQTTPGEYTCHECKYGVWHGYFVKEQYRESEHDVVNRAGYGLRPSFS